MHVEAGFARIFAGGDLFSHNTVITSTIANHFHGSVASEAALLHAMIAFFRLHSRNQRIPYDNALGLRTTGTGQWFLRSEPYAAWKSGNLLNMGCSGIPGAGKTVLSAIIIEDLINSNPEAAVLRIFNDTTQRATQTPQLIILNFLSQTLEQSQHIPPSSDLLALYNTYSAVPDRLPDHHRAKAVLKERMTHFTAVFIVVDALDEYQVGDLHAQIQLVRELETLGAKLLVTSRGGIPFASENRLSCRVAASPKDVRAFVDTTVKQGALSDVFRQREGSAENFINTLVGQSNGIFLSSKLLLESTSRCRKIADVNELLAGPESNLDQMYSDLLTHIRKEAPWVLPLVHFLAIPVNGSIGARAVLQYLACQEWDEGHIQDYVRTPDDVLTACRGLVVLVKQENKEDQGLSPSDLAAVGKGFQICHLTALEFIRSTLTTEETREIQLCVVHTLLRCTPKLLSVPPHATTHTTPLDGTTDWFKALEAQRQYIRKHYPLAFCYDIWLHFAREVQDKIDTELIDACYSHINFLWLLGCLFPKERASASIQLAISLSRHGLHLILHHFSTRSTILSPDDRTACLRAALLRAATFGHLESVKLLLDHHAPVDGTGHRGVRPLVYASKNGQYAIVLTLLEHGARPDGGDDAGWTSLMHASKHGHIDIVRLLLFFGASTQARDDCGVTPLMLACKNGHASIVEMLLEHAEPGTDMVDYRDNEGTSALMVASKSGQLGIVLLLLASNATVVDSADSHSRTPLMAACSNGHGKIVAVLLRHRANPNAETDNGWTAMMFAACRGHAGIVSLLIYFCASMHRTDENGQCPLHLASANGHRAVVKTLIAHRTDVDRQDTFGWTPLLAASGYGHHAVVAVLLDAGAPISTASKSGNTALTVAAYAGHHQVVKILLCRRRTAHCVQDKNGITPLMDASRRGHSSIVTLLLDAGADVHAVDYLGHNALWHAKERGFGDVAELLRAQDVNGIQVIKGSRRRECAVYRK